MRRPESLPRVDQQKLSVINVTNETDRPAQKTSIVPTVVASAPVAERIADAIDTPLGSPGWLTILHEIGAVDRATYEAVARTPTPTLDTPLRALSRSANHSFLWIAIATLYALVGGRRGRRAALEGIVAIAVTSASVNLGLKQVFRRRRPDRAAEPLSERHARMPSSKSFPSGHSAAAFAFAQTIGRHFPGTAVPLRMLAGSVAYSRVHVGVHYPGDVVIGSIIGAGTAAAVGTTCGHLLAHGR